MEAKELNPAILRHEIHISANCYVVLLSTGSAPSWTRILKQRFSKDKVLLSRTAIQKSFLLFFEIYCVSLFKTRTRRKQETKGTDSENTER